MAKWLPVNSVASEKVSSSIENSYDLDQSVEQAIHNVEIINSHKFEETREMMGDDVELIIDAFLESGTTLTAEMKKCSKDGNMEGLRNAFHALKGSCSVLGVQTFFLSIARTLKNDALKNDLDNIDEVVTEICKVFEISSSAIQELMLEKEI